MARMNIGLYQSASSLTALERWQDVVSQNISSGQVIGYKRRSIEFTGSHVGQFAQEGAQDAKEEVASAIFPHIGYKVDFSRGESLTTRGDLDLSIGGNGFFELQSADGFRAYTRSSSFQITPDRTVVNSAGDELMDNSGRPVQLLPTGGDISIDENGMLFQGGVPVAQIGVFDFPDTEGLIPIAGGMFIAAAGVEPQEAIDPQVIQGSIESSNVKPLREMVDLVNIARAYEANQRVIQSSDEVMKRTLETLG